MCHNFSRIQKRANDLEVQLDVAIKAYDRFLKLWHEKRSEKAQEFGSPSSTGKKIYGTQLIDFYESLQTFVQKTPLSTIYWRLQIQLAILHRVHM